MDGRGWGCASVSVSVSVQTHTHTPIHGVWITVSGVIKSHLDDAVALRLGVQRELDVALPDDAQVPDHLVWFGLFVCLGCLVCVFV